MSRLLNRPVMNVLFGSFLLFAAVPAATANEDVYRCRVLGDRGSCMRLPDSNDGESFTELVPGSHGRYLIHNGRRFEQAIADARAGGEEPTMQIVRREVRRQLSGAEARERHLRGGPALIDRVDVGVASRPLPVTR